MMSVGNLQLYNKAILVLHSTQSSHFMELSKNVHQLTTTQMKTRQLAEQYRKIQQNTEYLTHLCRYANNKRKIQFRPEINVPSLKSLSCLTVQLAYLLFTCNVKQTNILISKNLLLTHNKTKQSQQIYCQYMLQLQFMSLPPQQQHKMSQLFHKHQFNSNQLRNYGIYALQYINAIINIIHCQGEKIKGNSQKSIVKQFRDLENIVRNFIQPQIHKIQHPRVIILALEESQLFRENAILVKVMNNSLFSTIRASKHKNIFAEIAKIQNNLLAQLHQKQTLQINGIQIQKSIQQILRYLIKNSIITVQQSINDKLKSQGKNIKMPIRPVQQIKKQYLIGDVQGSNIFERRYICKIQIHQKSIRQFTSNIFQKIMFQAYNNYNIQQDDTQQKDNDNKQSKNQFLIEFYPGKGLLSIKCITPIQLTIDNTDIMMFQCNNIAYHWSNVSLELVQKSPNKPIKKKQRYIAIKTISHIHVSDNPLFKMLLMIDLAMVSTKIAEPELKKSVIRLQDFGRIQELSIRIEHIVRLFIGKIQKYYKMVNQPSFSKQQNQPHS